jgi:hypothetical protein
MVTGARNTKGPEGPFVAIASGTPLHQWQPHPPPQQPPPPVMGDAPDGTKLPSLFMPKTESFRMTSAPSQLGHATLADVRGRYFSKSFPQPRHRYS